MFSKTYPQVGATVLLCRPVSSISSYVKTIIFIAFLSVCSLKARSQNYYGGVQTIQMLHTVKERFKAKCPVLGIMTAEVYHLSKEVASAVGQGLWSLVKSIAGRIGAIILLIITIIGYYFQRIFDFEFDKFYEKIRNFFRGKKDEAPPERKDETTHEEIIETRVEEKFENGRLSTRVNHKIRRRISKKNEL